VSAAFLYPADVEEPRGLAEEFPDEPKLADENPGASRLLSGLAQHVVGIQGTALFGRELATSAPSVAAWWVIGTQGRLATACYYIGRTGTRRWWREVA
jgi:hypothetical protein